MKILQSKYDNNKPKARREIRNKYIVFEVITEGKKFQRIRPKEYFGYATYLGK